LAYRGGQVIHAYEVSIGERAHAFAKLNAHSAPVFAISYNRETPLRQSATLRGEPARAQTL
jgi:hypothetical protein